MTIGSRLRAPSASIIALSAVLSVPAFFAWGCARDKEPETQYIQGQAQYGAQAGMATVYPAGGAAGYGYGQPIGGGPGAIPSATPPGQPGTPLPGNPLPPGTPTSNPTEPPAPTPQPLDPAAASVVQPVLNELARAHTVAGAKPLGSPLVGNFQTGQKLEAVIQLQPQKCYTVVGTSLPPVTELNVQLVASTPLPNLNPVLAIDSETGPTAIVGKKPNCYKWAFPVPAPAKLVLEVAGGSGLAAAQVYEK